MLTMTIIVDICQGKMCKPLDLVGNLGVVPNVGVNPSIDPVPTFPTSQGEELPTQLPWSCGCSEVEGGWEFQSVGESPRCFISKISSLSRDM